MLLPPVLENPVRDLHIPGTTRKGCLTMFRFALAVFMMGLTTGAMAQTRVPQSQAEISLGFAPLVKEAAPAVVNIFAKRVTEARQSPFMGDPFFEEFFRGFGSSRPRVQNSLGSGVILTQDGVIVSNYHVVGKATEISVVLSDRREYSATVLLSDAQSDIAVLKIEAEGELPYLRLRNSDLVEVGELVLAIGNPFGIGQTVSSGIISGLARSGAATGNGRGYFIQTDAPINPGNSGGALIDVNGNLIGINTSIISRSGGSNGIGFAIPSNLVDQFVVQALDGNAEFARPWAGMSGQPVDSDLAGSLGLAVPEGILISDLHPESPFSKAGFKVGDVITEVDGLPVNSPPEMLFRMSVRGIGDSAAITRNRDGEDIVTDVAMMAAPDQPPANPITLGDKTAIPGLSVARINPAVITRLGLPQTATGVVVVDPGRIGARAGLKPGDLLLDINGATIATTKDVDDALTDPGRRLDIDALRRGQTVRLRLRL